MIAETREQRAATNRALPREHAKELAEKAVRRGARSHATIGGAVEKPVCLVWMTLGQLAKVCLGNVLHQVIALGGISPGNMRIGTTGEGQHLVERVSGGWLDMTVKALVRPVTHVSPELARHGIRRPLRKQHVDRLRKLSRRKPVDHLVGDVLVDAVTSVSDSF